MEKIKITYNQLSQIFNFFKILENSSILTFSQRRKLMPFNTKLEEHIKILNKQTECLIEKYGEKDEKGQPIQLPSGGYKVKSTDIQICNKELEEIATTEVEIEYDLFKLPENYFDNFRSDLETFLLINEKFIEK